MKLYIIDKKGILIALSCLIVALIGIGIMTSTGLEAVTTINEERKLPIYSVETDKKQVSISFDAAWGDEQTHKLLNILDQYDVKATFFLVGDWVDKYPDDVKDIADAGHDVGNHSDTHPHMTEMSADAQKKEISACNDKIKAITGKETTLFRAPFGDYNNSVVESVQSLNMYCVQWDIDSLDWKDPSPSEMVDKIVPNLQNGSIILMHNGATNTPEALPMIIEAVRNSGYEFVPLSKLVCKNCKLKYKTDVTGRVIG
ncbi:MAG: polysaccharide deacetylase family protein [Ruminococcus sp.]|nr:polysaccharide deacetylase family protein [Ruminococcus sp.]